MFEIIEKFSYFEFTGNMLSYFGLFIILFIEEGGVPLPIPGDIFIATASALPKSNYFLIILTVVASTLAGSTILFTLASKFGQKLLLKYGKYIKVTPEKIKRIDKWFEKYGGFAIVIGRLIPGLRIVTPIAAGLFGVTYKTFWFYTTIAAFIWANIYFIIGRFFGNLLEALIR
ncbi:DedA family protein [Candidatus Curtissbacteria bacterium]|nr:DedA family protein [Candidatus Curtissbacteria bacterium]